MDFIAVILVIHLYISVLMLIWELECLFAIIYRSSSNKDWIYRYVNNIIGVEDGKELKEMYLSRRFRNTK